MKPVVRVTLLILFLCANTSFGLVRHVPAGYPTIQSAIDASANGDTVLVAPGTYLENIVLRGKRIVVTSHYALNADPAFIQSTIINGSSPSHPDSGSCVRIINGEDTTTVFQGFTLTGGYGTLWLDEHGPGRYWEGGGIITAFTSPIIKHNIIRNNNVNRPGGASTGGGGIRVGDGSPRILNNIIMNNAGMYGGGIVSNYASPFIRNNIILHNVVSQAIAGSPTYGGGGIWFNGSVAGNRVENNTIFWNSSTGTVNTGVNARGGGMLAIGGSTINSRNNIIGGNTQTIGGQVAGVGATVLATYSDIEGGFTGIGNINKNPLFADTSYYLDASSPCVDAGDTSAAFNDPPDPNNPSLARWPARGSRRNDIGAYGGPWSSIIASVLTSVDEQRGAGIPEHITLSQNYPNPFNPSTRIRYQLTSSGVVSLKVYDLLGKEVATLSEGLKHAGEYTVTWNAGDIASGVYIYKLTAGAYNEFKKLVLVK